MTDTVNGVPVPDAATEHLLTAERYADNAFALFARENPDLERSAWYQQQALVHAALAQAAAAARQSALSSDFS